MRTGRAESPYTRGEGTHVLVGAEGWGSHPKRPAGFGLIEDALNRPTLRAIEGAVGVEDFDHALIVDAAKYDKVADRGKIAGMHAANDWTSTGERVLDALARGMNLRGLNAQHVGPACHERPFGRTRADMRAGSMSVRPVRHTYTMVRHVGPHALTRTVPPAYGWSAHAGSV